MKEVFEHHFTPQPENIKAILAYSIALNHVFLHLKEATLEGRRQYIEALPLIELISNTNSELTDIIKEIELQLNLQ